VEVREDVGVLAELELREVGVAEDAGEDVVEVVGNAAREQAEALELLALKQLALDGELVGLGALVRGDDPTELIAALAF